MQHSPFARLPASRARKDADPIANSLARRSGLESDWGAGEGNTACSWAKAVQHAHCEHGSIARWGRVRGAYTNRGYATIASVTDREMVELEGKCEEVSSESLDKERAGRKRFVLFVGLKDADRRSARSGSEYDWTTCYMWVYYTR